MVIQSPEATVAPDYLLGLSGLLKPPRRFMYCLYSVFFSFLTQ